MSVAEIREIKILCLHGIGTNADIFETQTAPIRYHLRNLSEPAALVFDFVDGTYPWPAPPEIITIYGENQPNLSYYDGSATSALAAIDNLAAYVIENGPYGAIMGFSMGGSLAATLLLKPHEKDADKPEWATARTMIQSAVFLSGMQPISTAALRREKMEKVQTQEIGLRGKWNLIDIPTLHIWSPADQEIPGESETLVQMCCKDKRAEIVHNAGHAVPVNLAHVKDAATGIQKMLAEIQG
ncbi:serine hydrolase FSH [Xylaria scruposa]|nr:serine hydrolase FSH [Xylaria scruposa]